MQIHVDVSPVGEAPPRGREGDSAARQSEVAPKGSAGGDLCALFSSGVGAQYDRRAPGPLQRTRTTWRGTIGPRDARTGCGLARACCTCRTQCGRAPARPLAQRRAPQHLGGQPACTQRGFARANLCQTTDAAGDLFDPAPGPQYLAPAPACHSDNN